MRVFLTGATGLIGSHVAEQLRARGDQVVAMVRPASDRRHLERLGCHLVEGDILDEPGRTSGLMRGSDAVVHAAARVFERGNRLRFIRQNVEGTQKVMEAAAVASPRVVHLSSVAVYSGLASNRPLSEDRWTEAVPDRQGSYPASKTLSERAAWSAHEQGAIRLTTVRPSVVYGERDRAATPFLVRAVRLPLTPLPGGGRTLLPVVYAGNVARGIVATLDREVAVGRAYNLALDTPVTGREMARLFARAMGRPGRILPVPASLLRAAAFAVEVAARVVPGSGPTGARRAVRSMIHDNPYDSSRARLELGWTQLIPHTEGVRRTMDWWVAREAE